MKSRTKDFPRGSTIDRGKSMPMYKAGACCLPGEAIREAAELDVRGFPLCKWNQWVTYQIARLRLKK